MLSAKFQVLEGGSQKLVMMELVDNKCPNGRSLSIRIPFTWNGFRALAASLSAVLEGAETATSNEDSFSRR